MLLYYNTLFLILPDLTFRYRRMTFLVLCGILKLERMSADGKNDTAGKNEQIAAQKAGSAKAGRLGRTESHNQKNTER